MWPKKKQMKINDGIWHLTGYDVSSGKNKWALMNDEWRMPPKKWSLRGNDVKWRKTKTTTRVKSPVLIEETMMIGPLELRERESMRTFSTDQRNRRIDGQTVKMIDERVALLSWEREWEHLVKMYANDGLTGRHRMIDGQMDRQKDRMIYR